MIAVEAIKFNHDPASASHDALNLRKNATQFITVPEWRRFLCVNPEDSRAAYAVAPTHGKTITIQASFSSTDHALGQAEIRAEHRVKQQLVPFVNGSSGYVTLELIDPPVHERHVGLYDQTWEWEYRIPPHHEWKQFAITRHRFYVVLDMPTAPWQQTPYNAANTQLPWSDVLDYACHWAAGATTKDAAAARVTHSVNALGPAVMTYDCPGGGSSNYSGGPFECTAFLQLLHGGVGNGIYVNCSDCATITSTFADALGCDLWQSQMGYGFDLNQMIAIGAATFQLACGFWTSFSYHEVAWEGACTAADDVFDACLKVNGGPNPIGAPWVPLLPVDARFGTTGSGEYRDRLATPAPTGRPKCNPQPGTRQRRALV
jgi:hypothetical protein